METSKRFVRRFRTSSDGILDFVAFRPRTYEFWNGSISNIVGQLLKVVRLLEQRARCVYIKMYFKHAIVEFCVEYSL